MLKGLHHVGVVVEDMARSLGFYETVLGGTIGLDLLLDLPQFGAGVGIPGAKARIVFLQIPGFSTAIELIQYHSPIGKHTGLSSIGFGNTHMAFQVANIEQTHRDFTQKGVRFLSEPSAFPPDHPLLGGVQFCYLQDPDGTLMELIQVPQ